MSLFSKTEIKSEMESFIKRGEGVGIVKVDDYGKASARVESHKIILESYKDEYPIIESIASVTLLSYDPGNFFQEPKLVIGVGKKEYSLSGVDNNDDELEAFYKKILSLKKQEKEQIPLNLHELTEDENDDIFYDEIEELDEIEEELKEIDEPKKSNKKFLSGLFKSDNESEDLEKVLEKDIKPKISNKDSIKDKLTEKIKNTEQKAPVTKEPETANETKPLLKAEEKPQSNIKKETKEQTQFKDEIEEIEEYDEFDEFDEFEEIKDFEDFNQVSGSELLIEEDGGEELIIDDLVGEDIPEPIVEVKEESKPKEVPKPKVEEKSEIKTKPESKSNEVSKPKEVPKPKVEEKSEIKTKPESKSKKVSKPEAEPKPKSESEQPVKTQETPKENVKEVSQNKNKLTEEISQIKNQVNQNINNINNELYNQNPFSQTFDPVYQIRRYHELKEDGIITEEEFEQKKKQLLDL